MTNFRLFAKNGKNGKRTTIDSKWKIKYLFAPLVIGTETSKDARRFTYARLQEYMYSTVPSLKSQYSQAGYISRIADT
jgi:hypothetical protein